MTGLRVVPARRDGRDRLYVSLPDGRHLGWYDRGDDAPEGTGHGEAGRVSLVSERHRDAVLSALAPYLVGEFTVGPPPVPTAADLVRLALHPDDDLAPNRPGETLRIERERRPATGLRLLANPHRARHAQLAAEESLGAGLDLLDAAGWRILHSVPLPGADRIDHLAIGPGGVLAIHTLAVRRLRVRIAGATVRAGRGEPVPLLRLTRRRAERASAALATAVRPVLAIVGAAGVEAATAPADVRILREREVPALGGLGGVHKPADIEALYALARDRRTWLRM
ncbi:nuclease-related domain-containing protein [Streptomyces sp. NPDC020965]|uniref:nuclease-related domain-containing protein n=1 Tax=Streptomyces sp. NPDC020965 TaxID=3365105 RepID=UPI0037A57665